MTDSSTTLRQRVAARSRWFVVTCRDQPVVYLVLPHTRQSARRVPLTLQTS